MNLKPANVDELSQQLAQANARSEMVSAFDLVALNHVLEHKAEDMTCRVEAGTTLAALQAQLAKSGQWLPLDPPAPERLSIGALLAANPSGPRRFGYGTVRDYLIGLTVVLADGRVIHSGGNVVKNVAGYDLMKLFIGSRGSLGMIVEAVFKLRPIPESEQIVETECATLDDADRLIGAVMDSELTPVVLDLHNARAPFCLVLGFAGTREEVDWQLSKARELGFTKTSSLDYDGVMRGANSLMQTISVLPSKMLEALRELRNTQFVARAGNGVIYCRGPQTSMRGGRTPSAGAQKLSERLKAEFDPSHILPALPS